MAVKETPLQQVKRLHGGKDKLVEEVVKALEAIGEEVDDGDKEDLSAASNKKLLRLHKSATTIAERYGSREKLVAALADAHGKSKDEPYTARLTGLSLGRLLDEMTSTERRARRKSKSAA